MSTSMAKSAPAEAAVAATAASRGRRQVRFMVLMVKMVGMVGMGLMGHTIGVVRALDNPVYIKPALRCQGKRENSRDSKSGVASA